MLRGGAISAACSNFAIVAFASSTLSADRGAVIASAAKPSLSDGSASATVRSIVESKQEATNASSHSTDPRMARKPPPPRAIDRIRRYLRIT